MLHCLHEGFAFAEMGSVFLWIWHLHTLYIVWEGGDREFLPYPLTPFRGIVGSAKDRKQSQPVFVHERCTTSPGERQRRRPEDLSLLCRSRDLSLAFIHGGVEGLTLLPILLQMHALLPSREPREDVLLRFSYRHFQKVKERAMNLGN